MIQQHLHALAEIRTISTKLSSEPSLIKWQERKMMNRIFITYYHFVKDNAVVIQLIRADNQSLFPHFVSPITFFQRFDRKTKHKIIKTGSKTDFTFAYFVNNDDKSLYNIAYDKSNESKVQDTLTALNNQKLS